MTIKKLLVALLGAVIYGVQTALSDGHLSPEEIIGIVALALGAFGTWLVPNTTVLTAAKAWVNGLLAGIAVLVVAIPGGIDGSEWFTIAIAVLTTAGVLAAPGAPLHQIPGQRGGLLGNLAA